MIGFHSMLFRDQLYSQQVVRIFLANIAQPAPAFRTTAMTTHDNPWPLDGSVIIVLTLLGQTRSRFRDLTPPGRVSILRSATR